MAPSRIAFAFGDLLAELSRLLPVDSKSTILLALDGETFSRVQRELRAYGQLHAAAPIFPGSGPALETFRFAGLSICRLPDNVSLDE